jgi:hypothetical protein
MKIILPANKKKLISKMNQKSDFRLSHNSKPNKRDQIIIIVVTDSTLYRTIAIYENAPLKPIKARLHWPTETGDVFS